MKQKQHPSIHNRGFSLIELMIAMVIGLLLLAGISSMFMTNKRIYRAQDEMGRLQENARFAMEMLIRDIRMTGYVGCGDDISAVTNQLNNGTNDDNLYSLADAVEGINNATGASTWGPSSGADQVANIVAGTDAITLRYLEPIGINIAQDMTANNSVLKVADVSGFTVNDLLGISDCLSAEVFQISQVTDNNPGPDDIAHAQGNPPTGPGNAAGTFSKIYDTDAEMLRFVARRYFIGNGTNGPALFRSEGYNAAVELIEGVENMQILYGIDTSGDRIADSYAHAAAVTAGNNWPNVTSVKLALLLRTLDDNVDNNTDANTYDLLDFTYDPVNDQRRRRIFNASVQIRNRGP